MVDWMVVKTRTLLLPFVHLVQKLDLSELTKPGSKPFSEEALDQLFAKLTKAFMGLLGEALQVIRRHAISDPDDSTPSSGKAASSSYEVLLTSEFMHLIPRKRELTCDVLHLVNESTEAKGDDAAYAPQQLSVNALGFAGMLLAKSDAEMKAIQAKGVVRLLTQVGVPVVEVQVEEEEPLA